MPFWAAFSEINLKDNQKVSSGLVGVLLKNMNENRWVETGEGPTNTTKHERAIGNDNWVDTVKQVENNLNDLITNYTAFSQWQ